MEVIKFFQDNQEIYIKGTYENPLFRTSDVAEILGTNKNSVRKIIADYRDTEKKLIKIDTPGGSQTVTFFTVYIF